MTWFPLPIKFNFPFLFSSSQPQKTLLTPSKNIKSFYNYSNHHHHLPPSSSAGGDFQEKMDLPDFSAGRSPRRELQGPRPAPLKVSKESHKIKKPPVVPQQQQQPPYQHQQTQQPRPPVIIYTVSPKVIHTNPSEFMNLVQRLTGFSSTSTSTSTAPASAFHHDGGAISPAARFASIERTRSPEGSGKRNKLGSAAVMPEAEMVEEMGGGGVVGDRNGFNPGILSPGPSSLPPIPPNLFSPLINDHQNQMMNPLNFLYEMSPNLHSNRNFSMSPMMIGESSIFMPSPSNLLSSHIVSPTHHQLDLFNSLFDI